MLPIIILIFIIVIINLTNINTYNKTKNKIKNDVLYIKKPISLYESQFSNKDLTNYYDDIFGSYNIPVYLTQDEISEE